MDAHQFNYLQEAYLKVFENQQLDEETSETELNELNLGGGAPGPRGGPGTGIGWALRGVMGGRGPGRRMMNPPGPMGGPGFGGPRRRMMNPPGPMGGPGFGPRNRRMNSSDSANDNQKNTTYEQSQIDLFDIILEYLISEGYADNNKSAIAIMSNMSEEWRQSIIENI